MVSRSTTAMTLHNRQRQDMSKIDKPSSKPNRPSKTSSRRPLSQASSKPLKRFKSMKMVASQTQRPTMTGLTSSTAIVANKRLKRVVERAIEW